MAKQSVVMQAPFSGGPPGYETTDSSKEPQVSWMTMPTGSFSGPPGLQYLSSVEQILVKQKIELLEAITGWETNNKYVILNTEGQQVYYAQEDTTLLMRLCCGPSRGFNIHITDNTGQEVMTVRREFKCCAGCSWCANYKACYMEAIIEAPPGVPIGYTRQSQSAWRPWYKILDANSQEVAYIRGPLCPCGFSDVEFPVFSATTNEKIGSVTKKWTGFVKEVLTDADNFSISFPRDLDVKMKAVFIGALFLIDFMYFESQDDN